MEQILKQILGKLDGLDDLKGRMVNVEGIMEKMEGRMDRIEGRLDKNEGIIERIENRLDNLEQLRPIIIESHQWLNILVENKEVQRAEMDSLKHHVSEVEGVLHGFDKSLEPLRKAQ